jgi:hypothetical protein
MLHSSSLEYDIPRFTDTRLTTHSSPTPIANPRNSIFESHIESKQRLRSNFWCRTSLVWSFGGWSFLPSVSSQAVSLYKDVSDSARIFSSFSHSSLPCLPPSLLSLLSSLPQSTSLFWVGKFNLSILPDRQLSHFQVIFCTSPFCLRRITPGRVVPSRHPIPHSFHLSTLSIKASPAIPHGYRFRGRRPLAAIPKSAGLMPARDVCIIFALSAKPKHER